MIQKTGGQRKDDPNEYVDMNDIGTHINCVVIEAMCLYLSGALDNAHIWHKCSEQQPETPRNALVIIDCYIKIGYWDGYVWDVDDWRMNAPTHWMNLPLMPMPEKEAESNEV